MTNPAFLSRMGVDPIGPRPSLLEGPLAAVPAPQASYDDYGHRPFIFPREDDSHKTMKKLQNLPRFGNTMIGIGSGFGILDMACVRGVLAKGWQPKLEHVIIVGRSQRDESLWKMMIPTIQSFTKRERVLEMLSLALSDPARQKQWFGGSTEITPPQAAEETAIELVALQMSCTTLPATARQKQKTAALQDGTKQLLDACSARVVPFSFLGSDARYAALRKLTLTFVRIDLFDVQAVTQLRQILDGCGATIDTVYLSNVEDFAREAGRGTQLAFREAQKRLFPPHCTVVTAQRDETPTTVVFEGKVLSRHLLRQKVSRISVKIPEVAKQIEAAVHSRLTPALCTHIAEWV